MIRTCFSSYLLMIISSFVFLIFSPFLLHLPLRNSPTHYCYWRCCFRWRWKPSASSSLLDKQTDLRIVNNCNPDAEYLLSSIWGQVLRNSQPQHLAKADSFCPQEDLQFVSQLPGQRLRDQTRREYYWQKWVRTTIKIRRNMVELTCPNEVKAEQFCQLHKNSKKNTVPMDVGEGKIVLDHHHHHLVKNSLFTVTNFLLNYLTHMFDICN